MTIKQWLWHLKRWLSIFPLPRHDDHMWIGLVGSGEYSCYCGASMFVSDDDDSDISEELKKAYDEDNS